MEAITCPCGFSAEGMAARTLYREHACEFHTPIVAVALKPAVMVANVVIILAVLGLCAFCSYAVIYR